MAKILEDQEKSIAISFVLMREPRKILGEVTRKHILKASIQNE